MVHFMGTEYRAHTSCISEAQKYQGALYKPKDNKKQHPSVNSNAHYTKNGNKANGANAQAVVPASLQAYVEDGSDESNNTTTNNSRAASTAPPPAAPSPPPAVTPVDRVNVFDFYEGVSTPNQSTLNLHASIGIETANTTIHEEVDLNGSLVQYGSGPVPTGSAVQTPAPKERERKARFENEPSMSTGKDKKRKRLHVDTSSAERSRERNGGDEEMLDAPAAARDGLLHTGLTGGLNRLLAPGEYFTSAEADRGDSSPVKKTKRSKEERREKEKERERGRTREKESTGSTGNGILSALMGGRKKVKKSEAGRDEHRVRKSSKRHEGENGQKLLMNGAHGHGAHGPGKEIVVFKDGKQVTQSADGATLFLSLVNKGPESERGCSMNKVLKRFHRERGEQLALGNGETEERRRSSRGEEKELWRCLRLRKNERGEVVVFFVEE
jgi:cell growth-regulating nucleolar protein